MQWFWSPPQKKVWHCFHLFPHLFPMKWPKYCSFSFSINPSKEIPVLNFFRMDWLHLLAVQGLSRVFSNTTVQRHQFFGTQPSSQSNCHIHTWPQEKPYVNRELPDVQGSFRKGRGTRDQIANIHWIMEKAREFQKNIYFCFIDYDKALTVWITINCGKFWKRWEYQTT